MSEFIENNKKRIAAGALAVTAAVSVGAGLASRSETSSEKVRSLDPTEIDATSSTTTEMEVVEQPLAPTTSETNTSVPITVEAPTTTAQLAPSGENELTPQSAEVIMAQLGHPKVGDVFQENILFTTISINENSVIYSAPDVNASRLTAQEGGITNAALLNEKYACFSMTSDNPEQPGLITGCIDIEQAGVDLDTIQKGSMTVEKVLEDGRGYGSVNGEEQVIAAFNSTANDVPNTIPPHGDPVTKNPDGSTNWGQPPITP